MFWNAPDWIDFDQITLILILLYQSKLYYCWKEHFEIRRYETIQIGVVSLLSENHIKISVFWNGPDWLACFRYFLTIITSPWLKKILKFDVLKHSRLVQFRYIMRIINSPWWKKIFKFKFSKSSRLTWFCCNFELSNSPRHFQFSQECVHPGKFSPEEYFCAPQGAFACSLHPEKLTLLWSCTPKIFRILDILSRLESG